VKTTITAKTLVSALDVCQKLAPPTSELVLFKTDGKRMWVKSSSDTSQCSVRIVGSVTGEPTEFGVPLSALKDALKGHEEVALSTENAMLHITSKGYSMELATQDPPGYDELQADDTQQVELNPDTVVSLLACVKAVALKPTSMLSQWIPVGIKLAGGKAFVCSYDNQRISWGTQKIAGELECVAPADTLISVLDSLKGQSVSLQLSRGRIRAANKLAEVSINIPIDEDLPSLDEVLEKVKAVRAVKGSVCCLHKEELLAFFTNARAITGKDRAEIESDGETLKIVSTTGRVQKKLKGAPFKIDFEFLVEAVSKTKDDVVINAVGTEFVSIKTEAGTLVLAQNQ
jgi:hypothetical protein